jgi:hypothetical protein
MSTLTTNKVNILNTNAVQTSYTNPVITTMDTLQQSNHNKHCLFFEDTYSQNSRAFYCIDVTTTSAI